MSVDFFYRGQLEGGGVASGGLRELIPCVARTAVAVGLFMEPLRHLEELLEELVAIAMSVISWFLIDPPAGLQSSFSGDLLGYISSSFQFWLQVLATRDENQVGSQFLELDLQEGNLLDDGCLEVEVSGIFEEGSIEVEGGSPEMLEWKRFCTNITQNKNIYELDIHDVYENLNHNQEEVLDILEAQKQSVKTMYDQFALVIDKKCKHSSKGAKHEKESSETYEDHLDTKNN
ncbi:hypothetical protein L6452_34749 [Arctium lappa]|uniref:Uncharacterized protein n=1 Tax=Arctium lappa TaxID=4217 RepID=A0ACB8YJT8_ARCLA|nr:hypothetical protein L6452_34749 [Arctium lappa]